ncbi:DUF1203 domain-containing protein [Aquimarina celericrescens]|uniref:DUF1203 domain-containing protein n=1 Tax=Aquimarina celericrescens TaxID=1964542 RepID=A0ABW5AVW1_9FLAO|nr:DUF1203 domain-containing protein [Aquimarina celericrescens]
MSQFKIIPLTKRYASKIRKSRKDDFEYQVIEQVASGFGPCRVSLKPFKPGKDKRLLLHHNPFEINNAFAQSGPIFIHAKEIESYSDIHKFPSEIKADKQNFPLTLIGYSKDQQMTYTKLVGDSDIDVLISEIFKENDEVSYLHARNSEAGCFICKIERIDAF